MSPNISSSNYSPSSSFLVFVDTLLSWISRSADIHELFPFITSFKVKNELLEILIQNYMKRLQNFHRKRPHLLPPLTDLPPSALATMGPLQPPDLLMESRIGSPAPKRNDPVESDYLNDRSDGKPVIKIFEPYSKESEKCTLKLDLLPDSISNEENDILHATQKRNSPNFYELDSKFNDRENVKNLSRKQFGYLHDDLNKKLKLHSVLPLEETKNLKFAPNRIISIPNRYTPLKPIGKDQSEN